MSKCEEMDVTGSVYSTYASSVFGSMDTEISSGWISVGGPIKGAYVVKNGTDSLYDYISDFGVRVEDPCQAKDNARNINLTPGYSTVKDLKYQNGTDSQFWLPNLC